jgi:hypothetical protein
MKALGGLAEVERLGHRDDVSQMTEFHAVESLAYGEEPARWLFTNRRGGLISKTSQSQRNIYF